MFFLKGFLICFAIMVLHFVINLIPFLKVRNKRYFLKWLLKFEACFVDMPTDKILQKEHSEISLNNYIPNFIDFINLYSALRSVGYRIPILCENALKATMLLSCKLGYIEINSETKEFKSYITMTERGAKFYDNAGHTALVWTIRIVFLLVGAVGNQLMGLI